MSLTFEHVTLGQRVLFGTSAAAANLAAEVARLGAGRVMVIASDFGTKMARTVAADIEVALWHHDVVMHVPIETAEKARTAAAEAGIDLLVCVGGGSTTGLAKAIAMTSRLPIIAVPTTYAGSEATNVWGLTEALRKTTGVDDAVLPVTIIYDAALTLSLPVAMSVASGLNGMAHCIDSMWAPRADPINAALGAEGIRALSHGLPLITENPSGAEGREQALYGAYLAAASFASAGAGLHHKICHVLGGTFNLPHAQTHAVMLPHVTAFNTAAAPEAERRIASALGSATSLTGLATLYKTIDAPRNLRDLGFSEDHIAEAAQLILPQVPASNPRRLGMPELERLLHDALKGSTP
ncbi:maleylacetate reductase [Arthrobacter cavernae]|uniref:Maleylacetate reductase n=1 Tax=Arthrobacter cavernae TaxID=2817681 RepID=A0A939KM98_9MICC|nr:maleylacetate reductase [Arthrobacter cavernae]MBO1267991.1 maleylacetate reductase [Arthrobacter cavernae]